MLLGKSSKQINTEKSILVFQAGLSSQPPWRNRLARSAVNRKVGGSSPPGGGKLFFFIMRKQVYVQETALKVS